jgi:hypothetical protein
MIVPNHFSSLERKIEDDPWLNSRERRRRKGEEQ